MDNRPYRQLPLGKVVAGETDGIHRTVTHPVADEQQDGGWRGVYRRRGPVTRGAGGDREHRG